MNMDDSELVELVELVEPINLEVGRFIWKKKTYMTQVQVAVAWVDMLYGLEPRYQMCVVLDLNVV